METIKLTQINIGDRLREDYGDVEGLAESIYELGLIQPIVLRRDSESAFTLVAGGRRLTAITSLGITELQHGITSVPGVAGFVYADELPEDRLRELELEENVRRKDMSWQERVLAIDEIHRLKSRRAALDSTSWGLKQTGELLGVTMGHTSWILQIAKELRAGSAIKDCEHLTAAIRWLIQQREDEAKAELVRISQESLARQISSASASPVKLDNATKPAEPSASPGFALANQVCFNHDCRGFLAKCAPEQYDHIVSDPPYAIDMDMLAQTQALSTIDSVRETHDVEQNKELLWTIMPDLFRVLKPKGFCVLWFDSVHWSWLTARAEEVGFRVQRWPLVWCKTSPCANAAAFSNFTKATEMALVLSKQSATLVKPITTNWITASNSEARTAGHPFWKPAEVWNFIFSAIATPGQSVLDPFAGAGSSTTAAIKFGLVPTAVEIDVKHYNNLLLNVQKAYDNA
jgi:DNA modification methylase